MKNISTRLKNMKKKSPALLAAKKKLNALRIEQTLRKSGAKKKIMSSYNSARKQRATDYMKSKRMGNKAGAMQARQSLMSDRNLMRKSGVSRSGFNKSAKMSAMRPMQSPMKKRPF